MEEWTPPLEAAKSARALFGFEKPEDCKWYYHKLIMPSPSLLQPERVLLCNVCNARIAATLNAGTDVPEQPTQMQKVRLFLCRMGNIPWYLGQCPNCKAIYAIKVALLV